MWIRVLVYVMVKHLKTIRVNLTNPHYFFLLEYKENAIGFRFKSIVEKDLS